jgi:hypothetical protein
MKTIIYEPNTKIFKTFSEAQIDPVETDKKLKPILLKSNEVKTMNTKRQQARSISLAENKARFDLENVYYVAAKRINMSEREMGFLISQYPNEAKAKLNGVENGLYDTAARSLVSRSNEMAFISEEMKTINSDFKKKQKELIISEAVYFGCGANEELISDVVYNKIIAELEKISNGEKLEVSINGDVVGFKVIVKLSPSVEISEVPTGG